MRHFLQVLVKLTFLISILAGLVGCAGMNKFMENAYSNPYQFNVDTYRKQMAEQDERARLSLNKPTPEHLKYLENEPKKSITVKNYDSFGRFVGTSQVDY